MPAFGFGSVVVDIFVCLADVWAWVICFCFCALQAFGVGLIVVFLFLWFASVWGWIICCSVHFVVCKGLGFNHLLFCSFRGLQGFGF